MMEKLDIEDLAANIMKFTVDKNGNVQIALETHSSDVDLEKLKSTEGSGYFCDDQVITDRPFQSGTIRRTTI